MTGYHHHQHLA